MQEWGGKEEKCRGKKSKGNSKIAKLKINEETQTHPECRKIYASDYANEVEWVKG